MERTIVALYQHQKCSMLHSHRRFGIVLSFILFVSCTHNNPELPGELQSPNNTVIPAKTEIQTEDVAVSQPRAAQHFRHFYSLLRSGKLSTDMTQWDDDARKEYLSYLPPEYHERFLDAYSKLHEAKNTYWKTRIELFEVLHPILLSLFKEEIEQISKQHGQRFAEIRGSRNPIEQMSQMLTDEEQHFEQQKAVFTGNYRAAAEKSMRDDAGDRLHGTRNEFCVPLDCFDPDKRSEYRNALTEEMIYRYGNATEALLKQAETHQQQTAVFRQRVGKETLTLEDLPNIRGPLAFLNRYFNASIPLNDEQKLRLLNDEPVFYSMRLGGRGFPSDEPRYIVQEYLKEARDAEREPWKIDATPELSKLGIEQADVDLWDGSLSLHPLIRAIAERCEGINTARLQTDINNASLMLEFGLQGEPGKTLTNTSPALMAVINGKKEIAFSTRRLSQAEMDAANKLQVELVQIPFAKDAFVFLQNRHNPVRNLTLEQYQGIFSGRYLAEQPDQIYLRGPGGYNMTNLYQSWKDVGGFGGTITPFIRNVESGSEELMQTLVMKGIEVHKDFKPQRFDSMSVIFEELETSPTGIAYSIYHYDRYMMFNPSTRVMAVDGVFPNAETIASGEYPLVYEAVLVHRKNPGQKVENFVRWLLSNEGQRLVRSVGYVPMIEL